MNRLLFLGFCATLGLTAASVQTRPVDSVPIIVPTDSVRKDPDTGLALDANLPLVKAHCTACHSSKLILQSHLNRDEWVQKIRWMQRTQKLWDLGQAEPTVLDYLTKYYGPVTQPFDGRRLPLGPVRWHPASR
jgi:hypothetical protein